MKRVFVVGGKRVPCGAMFGSLRGSSTITLASSALRALSLPRSSELGELFFGCGVPGGLGSSPGSWSLELAGMGQMMSTLVGGGANSGVKAIALGASAVAAGRVSFAVSGGGDSASNAGFLLRGRVGLSIGPGRVEDLLLTDCGKDWNMKSTSGARAEASAARAGVPRAAMDRFALESYRAALARQASRFFTPLIAPVHAGNSSIEEDDHPNEDLATELEAEIVKAQPCFVTQTSQGSGAITARNSARFSDSAGFVVLADESRAKASGPIGLELIDFVDAVLQPGEAIYAPTSAVEKLLARNRVDPERLAFIEVDESFAASPLILMKKLRIPREKVNAAGGSLVFGDGLGGSGPRMLIHLCELLKEEKGDLGVVVGYSSGSQSTALLVRKVKF